MPTISSGPVKRPDTSMVERVARTLAIGHSPLPDYYWPHWIPQARRVLAAMREPTVAMYAAGHDATIPIELAQDINLDSEGVHNVWTAMIDAALAEAEGNK